MERSNLSISQYVWWVERDSVLIAYYNQNSDKFISPSEDNIKITLFCIQRPDKFLLKGESPERDGFEALDEYLGITLDDNVSVDNVSFWEQESEIPEQFHEALIARVIANGYERKPETIQLATYFLSKYDNGVRECRKYSYRGRDGSQIQPIGIDF